MITHYVVEYNHETKEWSIGNDSTKWLIGDVLGGLTWERDTTDWFMLDEDDSLLVAADLAWRLNRKEYQNG